MANIPSLILISSIQLIVVRVWESNRMYILSGWGGSSGVATL